MKKFICGIVSVAMASLLLFGCGGGAEKKAAPAGGEAKKVVVKVGATPVPHAELLNFVKPQLAKEVAELCETPACQRGSRPAGNGIYRLRETEPVPVG